MLSGFAASVFFLAFTILPLCNCIATVHDYSTQDIPGLVVDSVTGDDEVNWDKIDLLIRLCGDPGGMEVLSGCMDEASRVLRLETIPTLGWMAYRIIEDDPDSDMLFDVMLLLAPMVDVDDEEIQLAAIKAVKTVLSSEIPFDTEMNPSARLVHLSQNNKYFAISIRAGVGGMNSGFDSVREFANNLLSEIGWSGYGGAYDSHTYTFGTSVGNREYAELVLDNLNLTLEQYIEFRLDLDEYVKSLNNNGYFGGMLASFYSFGDVFDGHPPEEIADYLDHWSPMIRGYAREALAQLGSSGMPFLNQAYENGNPRVRLELLELVKPDATDLEIFEHFDEVIHDPDSPISYEDSCLFTTYIQENRITSPDNYPFDMMAFLIRLLKSDQGVDLTYAIDQLGEFGPDAADAVPALIELLQNNKEEIGQYFGWPMTSQTRTIGSSIATTLGEIGPVASGAVPYLIEMRVSQPGIPEICATTALYGIGYNPDEMVDWLVDRINNETDPLILPVLAENLMRVGPDVTDAVPRLIELSDNPDQMTRYYARDAIIAIEGSYETVINMMVERLDCELESDRQEGASELYNMIDDADITSAIPVILDSLNDESRTVRNLACMILVKYGGYNEVVVPVIIDLLEPDNEQDMYIVRLLRDIGRPAVDPAESAVLNMILGNNSNNIQEAISVYKDIWGVTDRLLDKLIELATDFDNTWYFHGFDALGEIGAEASSTLPTLRGLLNHEDSAVRDNAQRTIDAIQADMEYDT